MTLTVSSRRFDRIANNYATSEVHASSASMCLLHELLSPPAGIRVCDVACGAGHLALSFGPVAGRIVGVDPSPSMLESFVALADRRGLAVDTVQARSESIPLPDAGFDLAMSRLAPHHFADIERAIAEMARLVRVGGHVAVIDLEGYPTPEIDGFNHEIEVLHDPTHVRSYPASRWRELFEGAGLKIVAVHGGMRESETGVTIRRWCEIASSGPEAEAEIRRRLGAAPGETLAALGIERDGDEFRVPVRTVLILGQVVAPG